MHASPANAIFTPDPKNNELPHFDPCSAPALRLTKYYTIKVQRLRTLIVQFFPYMYLPKNFH
jgi:hypothetical protein